MKEATFSPPHPIVFIFDFSNSSMSVPEYNGAFTAAANESCISVRTIADVDGDVTVWLSNHLAVDAKRTQKLVYEGTIKTPSRKVAVVTSHNEKLIEIDVFGPQAHVAVAVNDEEHPSKIWVEAR